MQADSESLVRALKSNVDAKQALIDDLLSRLVRQKSNNAKIWKMNKQQTHTVMSAVNPN